MYGRLVCALVFVWLTSACVQPVAGSPVAAQGDDVGDVTETTPPSPTSEFPTEEPTYAPPPPSSTTRTSSGAPVTIAKRKTITTPPACAAMITTVQIGQLTGSVAKPEPEDKGYCSYTLAKGGTPAGVALIVLTPTLDSRNTEQTTFEGNTAHRLTTQSTTCDIRVALTDDPSAPFRVLWVSLVLSTPGEPTCTTVEKVAKIVFDKLPDG